MNDYPKLLRTPKPLILLAKLLFLPCILFALFFFMYRMHLSLAEDVERYDVSQFTEEAPVADYPLISSPYTPLLTAQAAVIMDDDSKVVLYKKNADLRFSMASTTKLMTALVALEAFSLSDTLFVYSDVAEGSTIGLRKGEQYTLESLLYAMMLPSANDAAQTIASNYPGGSEAFVQRMNEKASELLLSNTQYDDPAGLSDDGNYTTAMDLANLASIAMQHATIAKIAGTKIYTITDASGKHQILLENLNELLGTNGVVGVKTGYTQGAGGVLTTARKHDGHTQILVVMRSVNRFADTRSLLQLITGNLTYIKPSYTPFSMTGVTLTQP